MVEDREPNRAPSGEVDAARATLGHAGAVLAFTGAGVSTASGIPDFRGPGGLWSRFDPSEFEYDRFLADPARFWRFRVQLTRALNLDGAKPNVAHLAMADAVRRGALTAVVTQNIDGLHQAAGTPADRVLELHGNTRFARCMACRVVVPIGEAVARVGAGEVPPRCALTRGCAGVLKPDVVLFGELLPEAAFARALAVAEAAGAVLVVGSSLGVWPAAGIPERVVARGGALVLVNDAPTPFDGVAAHVLRGRVEDVVPRLLAP